LRGGLWKGSFPDGAKLPGQYYFGLDSEKGAGRIQTLKFNERSTNLKEILPI